VVTQEASAIRTVVILKAATNPDISYREIDTQLNVSKDTISHVINQFSSVYQLTEAESDFPRKLLRFYNVNLPQDIDHLNESDVRLLRRHVERVRRGTATEDEMENLPGDDNPYLHRSQNPSS
jgi:hypothetical protein